MKKFYLVVMAGLFSMSSFHTVAQQIEVDRDFKKNRRNSISLKNPANPFVQNNRPEQCGYNIVMGNARKKGFKDADFEAQLSRLISARQSTGARFTGPVTIPVVFHVIYRNADVLGNSSPNLAANKFQSQVDQLNRDYGNLSGSAYGVAADVQIRFCLAVVDPQGKTMAEPGIERINGQARGFSNTSTQTQNALISNFDNTIKPATIWDPYSYFNVWSAAMNTSGLLGYATFPALSGLPGLDNGETDLDAGVVLNWESIGSVANPGADVNYGYGRTLTHEAGHFFGLRHITGDSNCGNDFCADTPPQDDLTSGCPAPGTSNNCSPAQPKMFENYMDYSNDACLNTFTANQALRSQTVMDNSPRRLELISSRACQVRAGNAISFGAKVLNVSEKGLAGACPNVRTYTISLYVPVQATGAATVNFTHSGTATVNKDFTISPASVAYTANDASVKTITLTVIDDEQVEPTETINLSYSISGTGVVAGPDKQTVAIKILNDDINVPVSTTNLPLLSQNFEGGNIPAGWVNQVYGDGLSTPNSWVVSGNAGMTGSFAAHITDNVTTKPLRYNNLNESDAYLITPLIDATGLKNVNLSFTYKVNGESTFDEGYIGFIPEGLTPSAENVAFFSTAFTGQPTATNVSLNLPASFNNTKFYFVFNWYNDASDGVNPPFAIDNIVFSAAGLNVATTTDADTTFNQFATQQVQYFSNIGTTSRILATVNNPNQDLGCVTAAVSLAGTGLPVLNTSAGSFARSSKVIRITPATPNSSATYQATFYYTSAELAAWGTNAPNLKLMKVADGVDLSGTITAGQIVTPVFNDQRATRGYASYTGSFTGGFSQFLLVSPATALPVSLISFEARPVEKAVLLNWSTAMELNNKGFVIERSKDGINFETIGWKDGAMNSSQSRSYSFTDNFVQPDQLYYYRLRQTDIDNRETLSAIRKARITDRAGLMVSVSPNPATNMVKVFASGTVGLSNINLLDAKGQLVQSWKQVNCSSAAYKMDISHIVSGVYLIQVVTGDAVSTQKLIVN